MPKYVTWHSGDWSTIPHSLRAKIVNEYVATWSQTSDKGAFIKMHSRTHNTFVFLNEALIRCPYNSDRLRCPSWLIPLVPTLMNLSSTPTYTKALKLLINKPDHREILSTYITLSNTLMEEDKLFSFLNKKSLVKIGELLNA